MKIEPRDLKRLIDLAYTAHQEHNIRNDFRQNGKVPFVVHPMWCALTILNDQRIPFEERKLGYQVLLLHDVLEDTSLEIPADVDREVLRYVKEMTHDSWEEEKNLAGKSPFIKLLKLCDKIASMYDETVRDNPKHRKEWKALTQKLLEDVESHYGDIRLVLLAKAVLDACHW
jgi:(p)ppGpp synthase/HD superfamily hydrolase